MQMNRKPYHPVWLAGVLLLITSLACGALQAAPATAPTDTSAPPTSTSKPTSTPRPTATPNIAATKEVEEAQANVKKYVDSGYLSSTDGTLYFLDDFQQELAKKNYLDVGSAGYDNKIKDFAVWADVKEESAGPVNYPEFSGCGFVFHFEDNGDQYYTLVTKDSILVAYCLVSAGGHCGRAGKTRGTGTVKLGSPFNAHFEFIVNGTHAYALVNGGFVAEYTLFSDKINNPGYFGYGMISGTNKDYGTRCEITNAKLWVPNQ
jgi:hypothetical protein